MSRWLAVSWSAAAFFRFSSVAALSCSVEDLSEACSAAVPPVSWTLGSFDPPLRTTFFGGGQGFKAVAFAFVDPAFADPPAVESSAGLPTVVFRGVGAFEQGGIVFLRRG